MDGRKNRPERILKGRNSEDALLWLKDFPVHGDDYDSMRARRGKKGKDRYDSVDASILQAMIAARNKQIWKKEVDMAKRRHKKRVEVEDYEDNETGSSAVSLTGSSAVSLTGSSAVSLTGSSAVSLTGSPAVSSPDYP